MRVRLFFVGAGALAVGFLLSGCNLLGIGGPASLSTALNLQLNGTSVSGGNYDFGYVDPSSVTGSVQRGTLRNDTLSTVTVSAISSGDSHFTFTTDRGSSFTLNPGDNANVVATFVPTATGPITSTFTIKGTVTGIFGTRNLDGTINVTGNGNYAPRASFQVSLTGAGTAAVNGTYDWDSSVGEYGAYVQQSGTNYIYPTANGCSAPWYVSTGAQFGAGTDYYSEYTSGANYGQGPLVNSASSWSFSSGATPSPTATATGQGIEDSAGAPTIVPGATLRVKFVYSDADGDAAATATYQWQRSSSGTDTNSYSIPNNDWTVVGSNSPTYALTGADGGMWFRVRVVPSATSGTTAGAGYYSDPIFVFDLGC